MSERKFRKGDRVRFQYGVEFVEGEVKEDRGPIGVRGRHLYLVEFRFDPWVDSPSHVELPAVEMEPVSGAVPHG